MNLKHKVHKKKRWEISITVNNKGRLKVKNRVEKIKMQLKIVAKNKKEEYNMSILEKEIKRLKS